MNAHENTYPHSCQYCGKGFNKPKDKTQHEEQHIRKVMELQIDQNTGEMAYKEKIEVVEKMVRLKMNLQLWLRKICVASNFCMQIFNSPFSSRLQNVMCVESCLKVIQFYVDI